MNMNNASVANKLPRKRRSVIALPKRQETTTARQRLQQVKQAHLDDKYEQQARSYSSRWRGCSSTIDLSFRQSSFIQAQAASFRAPTSVSSRLPVTLAEKLSDFFNADLSAVRIHADQSANQVTEKVGAKAFTSGAHIYFSSGQYQPSTESGQALLVHELTHALQQTGRTTAPKHRGAANRIRVTEISSSGDVQMDWFIDQLEYRGLLDATPSWDEVKNAYHSEADFQKHADRIEKINRPPKSDQAIKNDFAKEIEKSSFAKLSSVIKGFYVDALKLNGYHDLAFQIVKDDSLLPTTFRSKDFYAYVQAESLDWLSDTVKSNSLASKFFPDLFERAYFRFFLSPDKIPIDLQALSKEKNKKTFAEKMIDEVDRLKKQSGFVENELSASAVLALYYLDKHRLEKNESMVTRNDEDTLVDAIRNYALLFKSKKATELFRWDINESIALFEIAFPNIRRYAKKAAKFWKKSSKLHAAHIHGKSFQGMDPEQVARFVKKINDGKRFKRFKTAILEVADDILGKKASAGIKPADFADIVRNGSGVLTQAIASFVGKTYRKGAKSSTDSESAILYGLVTAHLADFEHVLFRYDLDRAKSDALQGLDDERTSVRIRYARKLRILSKLLGWKEGEKLAAQILDKEDILAITGSWTFDKARSTLNEFSKSTGHINDWQSIQVGQRLIANYIFTRYHESMILKANEVIDGTYTGTDTALNVVLAAAREEMKIPQRHVLENWTHTLKANSKEPGSKRTFDLLVNHKKIRDYLSQVNTENHVPLYPQILVEGEPLVIWLVPEFNEAILRFTEVDRLRQAVNVYLTELGQPKISDPTKDPAAWLSTLARLVNLLRKFHPEYKKNNKDKESKKSIKERTLIAKALIKSLYPRSKGDFDDLVIKLFEELSKGIWAEVKREQSSKIAEAVFAIRKATSKQLRKKLKGYDRYNREQRRVPDEVFSQIEAFHGFVKPEDQKLVQVSTLLIEIAKELLASFGPKEGLLMLVTLHERRHKVMGTIVTLLSGVLEQWDKEVIRAKGVSAKKNRILESSWMNENAVLNRVVHLKSLYDSYANQVVKEQRRKGLIAEKTVEKVKDDGTTEIVKSGGVTSGYFSQYGWSLIKMSMNRSTTLNVGAGFTFKGYEYILQSVDANFEYHPGFGGGTDLKIKWPKHFRTGDPILNVEGKHVTPETATGQSLMTVFKVKERPPGKKKTVNLDDGEVISITDKDLGELFNFYRTYDDMMGFAYLGGAGNFIEAVATAELELLELALLKGGGKAVKLTIILGEIAKFLVSTDFDELREKLYQNPKLVKELVKDLLKGGSHVLVEKLLFGKLPFETALAAPEIEDKDKRTSRTSRAAKSRLRKLMKFVTDRSEEALRSFVRLRGKVRGSFVGVQSTLLASPLLYSVIEAIPELLAMAHDAVEIDEALDLANPDKVKREIETQLQEITDSFLSIDLPSEIIPMELATEIIISYGLRAFGVKGKLISEIVQAVRADALAGRLLKERFENHELNPNKYWKEELLASDLMDELKDARNKLYEEIRVLIRKATRDKIKLDKTTKNASLNLDTGTPQLDAKRVDGSSQVGTPAEDHDDDGRVDFGGGTLLPLALLGKFGDEFGHNFEHVRVHRGQKSTRLTDRYHALALTSGSHIFLSDRVSYDDSKGQNILRHELAHVLQQAGPRENQSHREHSSVPIVGNHGKGLSDDSERERQADRMALKAKNREDTSEPIEVEGVGGSGLMPTTEMTKVATTLLDALVKDNIAQEHATAFEKPGKIPTKVTFKHARSKALRFWLEVRKLIASNKKSDRSFSSPFDKNETSKQMAGYLIDGIDKKVNSALSGIVMRSLKTTNRGTVELKLGAFTRNLETYIFARSGIALDISYGTKKKPSKVKIKYLHIPYLNANTRLYRSMKANTEKAAGVNAKYFTENNGWARTRKIIESMRHNSLVWDDKNFQLSDEFIKELVVGEPLKNIPGLLVITKDVKIVDWEEYVNPSLTSSATAGLRVATHAQLKNESKKKDNMPKSASIDRQSHHLPQYLLIEYFRGGNRNLFGKKAEILPGFVLKNGALTGIKGFSLDNSNTPSTINFDDYDPDSSRGANLPAISLAAVTHQKGRLHTNAASSWDPGDEISGKGTQSQRIDSIFWKSVRSKTGVSGKSKTKVRKAYNALPTTKEKKKFTAGVYKAMQHTYDSMYSYMIDALPKALEKHEVSYFQEVALAANKTKTKVEDLDAKYQPNLGDLTKVITAVKDRNKDIMGAWKP